MSAPHKASGLAEVVDLILVAVFLGSAAVLALSVRGAVRKARLSRQKRRAWLRDFTAEARERDGRQQ